MPLTIICLNSINRFVFIMEAVHCVIGTYFKRPLYEICASKGEQEYPGTKTQMQKRCDRRNRLSGSSPVHLTSFLISVTPEVQNSRTPTFRTVPS